MREKAFSAGMCTLIGTSTNLIIAARYDEDYPEEASIGTKAGQSRQEKKRKDESLVVFPRVFLFLAVLAGSCVGRL